MILNEVPCKLYTLTAANGDPLLLFGDDGANVMLWPLEPLFKHRIAFARWSRGYVENWRGRTIRLQHPMCERTRRWAAWLGVQFVHDEVRV